MEWKKILHVLPSSWNPSWLSTPEMLRNGFQPLGRGERVPGLRGAVPEARASPEVQDLGGGAAWSPRPWESSQKSCWPS